MPPGLETGITTVCKGYKHRLQGYYRLQSTSGAAPQQARQLSAYGSRPVRSRLRLVNYFYKIKAMNAGGKANICLAPQQTLESPRQQTY